MQNLGSPTKATFPFDPAPFIPPNYHIIEVEDRPARAKIINGAAPATQKEWAIASIVPMPNLPVAFDTIREVLSDFLNDKQLVFSEIEPCPFGQAYVKINSGFDHDGLVGHGPHQFTDVHVIFQPHNKGMN